MSDADFKRLDTGDEKLIAAAVKYLRYHDPENATREDAISLLEFMQIIAKEAAATMSEDSFDNYYKAYKEQLAKD